LLLDSLFPIFHDDIVRVGDEGEARVMLGWVLALALALVV
jgi:hypothetical protein